MADALQMLRDDHKRLKDLFKQFEDADDSRSKGSIVDRALSELEMHAELEEEIFYPAVRKEANPDDGQMDEAEEEHHVAKLLIAELRKMKPGAARYDAKFTVLAENVKHHIDEEESEMLPKAAELGMERMAQLGAAMEQRKMQLTKKAGSRKTTTKRQSPKRPAAKRSPGRPAAKRTPAAKPIARAARKTATKTAAPRRRASAARPAAKQRAGSTSRRSK
jgi:hemerythrin-like domain-containing protein